PVRPEASPARELKVIELRNNGPEARALRERAGASRHRSVYLPLLRGIVPTSLEVFDFAEQGMVTGRRDATTVPTPALYLLNDPSVRRQSLALADRLLARGDLDDAGRADLAYRLIVGRGASDSERARVAGVLAEFEAEARAALAAEPDPAPVALAAAEPPK